MSNHIHPLVMATIEEHRARRELELERLRSARNACTTASPGGQSRAMALGKKIREVEAITSGWRLALAVLLDEEMTATEDGPGRVVGSRTTGAKILRCNVCTARTREEFPLADGHLVDVTSEDLPDGGMCDDCHADVLA